MDQQALGRAANPGPAGFGVHHDLTGLFGIRILVDIDVHDAFQMGKDRHAGLALDQSDKALTATRNDHVHMVSHGQHLADRRSITGRDQLNSILGQTGGAQSVLQAFMDQPCRMEAFRTAPQDHRVSGLQAQCTRIRRHVRAAFIDHTDHAQRGAHAANVQARGTVPFFHYLAHRVILSGHGPQPVAHAFDPIFVQHQAVHHRV